MLSPNSGSFGAAPASASSTFNVGMVNRIFSEPIFITVAPLGPYVENDGRLGIHTEGTPMQNPNWPRLQALWSPGGHIGYGPSAASYELLPWVDVTPRLIGPWQ